MKAALLVCLLPALATAQLLCAGCIEDIKVDPTEEPVVFAVKAINDQFKSQGDNTERQLAEVVRARSQVVAGQKLYLTLRLTGAAQDDYCTVDVWYRVWLTNEDRLIITEGPTCSKTAPTRRQVAGGISSPVVLGTQPPQEVADALSFAACKMNDASNDMFFSVLGDTSGVKYTQQVTAGMTYRFYHVPLLTTSCRKAAKSCQETDLTVCEVADNARTTTCDFTVQWQAWMNPKYTLTSLSCH